MTFLTYISVDGNATKVDVAAGSSLMLGAVQNNIKGIDGECGGCLSCATCHVYLDPEWVDRVPPPEPMEAEMLTSVAADLRPSSRLACQVMVTPALEGMRVYLPRSQT